jgi:p-hydroxybenzoate 3-monooxygenase
MLHKFPDACEFDERRQLAELEFVTTSKHSATALAETYVGQPFG